MTLGRGINIGGRYVGLFADIVADGADIGPAEALQFGQGHLFGIADDAALGAAQGYVDHGCLPRHPCCQGADGVDGLVGVEAQAAFRRPSRIVVLDPEAVKDLGATVVHLDRQRDVEFAQRPAQQLVDRRVQLHDLGGIVQL